MHTLSYIVVVCKVTLVSCFSLQSVGWMGFVVMTQHFDYRLSLSTCNLDKSVWHQVWSRALEQD